MMLDCASKFASSVATVRVPNNASFVIDNGSSSSSSTRAVSFVVDARSAAGTATSEAVTCVIQKQQGEQGDFSLVTTVVNQSASANSAAYATLTTADGTLTARFSKLPADKKQAQQNGPFRATLELFDALHSTTRTFVVSNKKHGEVLADAHLQQLGFDRRSGKLYFVVRSAQPTKPGVSLEEFLADSAAPAATEAQQPAAAAAPSDTDAWNLRTRYEAGEGYPQLFGTEVVSVTIPPLGGETGSAASSCTLVTERVSRKSDTDPLVLAGYPCCVSGGVVYVEYVDAVTPHLQRGLMHCFAARATKTIAVLASGERQELDLGEVVKQLTVYPYRDSKSNTVARLAYFDFQSKLPMGRRPHLGCAALCIVELDAQLRVREGSKRTLVPIVYDASADAFPGLYPVMGLGDLQWTADGQSLYVASVRRSAHVVYEVAAPAFDPDDTEEELAASRAAAQQQGAAAFATPVLLTPANDGSWRLAATSRDGTLLVAVSSSTTRPPQVHVRATASALKAWTCIYSGAAAFAHTTTVQPLCSAPAQGETLLHLSAAAPAAARQRYVVFVHGGPHSTDVNSYSRGQHILLECGFHILSINYRGSLGFGQSAVQSLLSRIGTQDVSDVIAAVKDVILSKATGALPPPLLFVAGGSHGGFLSCHLAGHASQLFAAAAIRNPVTDVLAMAVATDIEDWCLTEAGAAPDCDSTSASARMLMDRASPILSAGNVKIPCLLGIGDKDLRVPPFQGRAWARAVRQNKHRPDVVLIEYPNDSHGLETPTTDTEFAIQTCAFFLKAAQ